ncbi:HPF/RaiA family ribosome-associated protein [Hydrogenophaga sp. 2FB]|uniref:HPF/RaiA family ribosome-associated protein n=1 Tax=Hydrogenophaga sp. 2FB TaxID=2502187 RepID=UPI0010F89BAC|nr:HPF/RaiA family ribosome-associated protein [Hydrogenophaga sp. 2FB]MDP3811706.1 HPF/RaiA family ribosome-associated protein [Hydrogenophaga sp.]
MVVDIHGQGFTVTQALGGHVRSQLGFVLSHYGDRIRPVSVRIGDEKGSCGGVDMHCRIQFHLLEASDAVVESVGADMYVAIDRAADRVGRLAVKHLDRTHPFPRRHRMSEPGRPETECRWRSRFFHSEYPARLDCRHRSSPGTFQPFLESST